MNVTTKMLERREAHCINILSDDKQNRKDSRILLISQWINDRLPLLTKDQKIDYPNYALVSDAINLFTKHDEFIFKLKAEEVKKTKKLKAEEAGSILSKNKSRKSAIHSYLSEDSELPTYFVTMPHLLTNKGLSRQIKLIFEEGFLSTKEKSLPVAKKRLHLFVGINFCYTLDPIINKKNKALIEKLFEREVRKNVSLEAFCWAPHWTYSYEVPKKTEQPTHATVKRIYRLLSEMDLNKASKIYDEVMNVKLKPPFQRFRQEIVISPSFSKEFKSFRKARDDRPCFLGTVDDDAVSYRLNGKGLYSNYDKLILKNVNLEAATTGYLMLDPENIFVEIGSTCNLISRYIFALLRANATYLPEPNGIFKLPTGKKLSKEISFIDSKDKMGTLESLKIMQNMGLSKGDMQGRVVVGGIDAAMQTAVSPNVEIPIHLRNVVEALVFTESKNLASLRKFSQTTINSLNGFAFGMLSTYEKSNTGKNRGLVASIYKAFDPIEYAKTISTDWVFAYPSISNRIFEVYKNSKDYNAILSDPEQFNDDFKKYSKNIVTECNLGKGNTKKISNLIKAKVVVLFKAKKALLETKKFEKKDIKLFVKASRMININIHEYLVSKIWDMPFNYNLELA